MITGVNNSPNFGTLNLSIRSCKKAQEIISVLQDVHGRKLVPANISITDVLNQSSKLHEVRGALKYGEFVHISDNNKHLLISQDEESVKHLLTMPRFNQNAYDKAKTPAARKAAFHISLDKNPKFIDDLTPDAMTQMKTIFKQYESKEPDIENAIKKAGGKDALSAYKAKRADFKLDEHNDEVNKMIKFMRPDNGVVKTKGDILDLRGTPSVPTQAELKNAAIEDAIFNTGGMDSLHIYRLITGNPFPNEIFVGFTRYN
ncbi:MAG: hypothetical protein LBK53_09080 [Heliobacteriaceae bacterium]|jgi:hypothetical protein|nr:hypothetical protein [Heliobacteriaceae bacterium]